MYTEVTYFKKWSISKWTILRSDRKLNLLSQFWYSNYRSEWYYVKKFIFKLKRRLKNRLSAQAARERKKQRLDDLEARLRFLSVRLRAAEEENLFLREKLAILEMPNFEQNSQTWLLPEPNSLHFTSFSAQVWVIN